MPEAHKSKESDVMDDEEAMEAEKRKKLRILNTVSIFYNLRTASVFRSRQKFKKSELSYWWRVDNHEKVFSAKKTKLPKQKSESKNSSFFENLL